MFWSNVHDLSALGNASALLDAVAIDGSVMYVLEDRLTNVWDLCSDQTIHALALAYTTCRTQDDAQSVKSAHMWEDLLTAAVGLGLSLHGPSDRVSPLLKLLHTRPVCHPDEGPPRDMEARLRAWVTALQRWGVELYTYGQEERRRFLDIRRRCEQPWSHGVEEHKCDNKLFEWWDFEPTLFAFSYGTQPSDWELWLVHPGDQYAGHFWQMVEEGNRDIPQSMPGGWIEAE